MAFSGARFDDRRRDQGGRGADDEGRARAAEFGDRAGEGTAGGGTTDQHDGQPGHDAAEQRRFGGLQDGDGRGDEQRPGEADADQAGEGDRHGGGGGGDDQGGRHERAGQRESPRAG